MPSLGLYLLGSFRLERDRVPLVLDTRKNMALIAYLSVTGRDHSREALVTLLWPELEPTRARAGLRRNLSTLKKTVGEEWFVVDRESIGLDPTADLWLDIAHFRRLLETGQEHDHLEGDVCPECLTALTEAIELYRGDFLEGFSLRDSVNFDEWQFFETESLRLELASALERLVHGFSAREEYDAAIPYARRWLALDPLHEPVHRHLMQLYALDGQRAAALRQYQECSRILKEELDLPPSEGTTSLYEQIRSRRTDPVVPLHPAPVRRHNLPAQTTPFVGREKELAKIKARLNEPACRLLTLVGPGGTGKTRLALKAAEELASETQSTPFGDGVYLASLAPLDSVDAVVPAMVKALGFPSYEGGTPQRQLLDYLAQKRLLLILDNFEHLLAGAGLVADILQHAPDVKVLATSRARLNVQGEYVFHVTGMLYPDWDRAQEALDYSAVQLFVQSALRLRTDFVASTDDLKWVTRICQLVQGMPLGILLAAGWMEMLSPQEIAGEISQSLGFLETDLRDVPERQRSIRAVFEHSWRLLSQRQREVFQGMSVFRGGFTREAAQQVTGASLRELRALVNKSLLHHIASGRYEVHELLRRSAAERLSQAGKPALVPAAGDDALSAWDTVRDRHSAYYTALLGRLEPDLKSARQQAAVAEIDAELENMRVAWEWASEQGRVDQLDQAMDSLALYWRWRSRYQEAQVTFEHTVERLSTTISQSPSTSGEEYRILARLLAWQYRLWGWADGRAGQQLRQAQELLDRPEIGDQDTRQERAFILHLMAFMAADHDPDRARELCRQSLALYRALGDQYGLVETLDILGRIAEEVGAYDEARKRYEESLALRQVLGDQKGFARSLMWLSGIAEYQGRPEEAIRLARESITVCREIDDHGGVAFGIENLGRMLVMLGRPAEAHSLLEESPAILNNLGYKTPASKTVLGLAKAHMGCYEEAREQGQAALTLASELGYPLYIGLSTWLLGCVALAEEAYAEAQSFFERSASATHEAGYELGRGRALAGLGYAYRGLGRPSQAWQCVREALRMSAGTESPETLLLLGTTLLAVALLLADMGQEERAVELHALASRQPFVASSRWLADVAGQHIAAAAATLSAEELTIAQKRGRTRDLETTASELLAELEG